MNPILTLSPVAPPAVLGAAPLAAVVLAGVAAGAFAGVLEQAAAIIPIAISSPILRFNIPLPLPGSSPSADASAAAVPGDALASRGSRLIASTFTSDDQRHDPLLVLAARPLFPRLSAAAEHDRPIRDVDHVVERVRDDDHGVVGC